VQRGRAPKQGQLDWPLYALRCARFSPFAGKVVEVGLPVEASFPDVSAFNDAALHLFHPL
jgi:hypothetical protein